MSATLLHPRRVEKSWGRHDLGFGFGDVARSDAPVGEVWFQESGDTKSEVLIKYLFTGERLSVQVHPNDDQAQARGLPRGKDECWIILEAKPGATIALGPEALMTLEQLRDGAQTGAIVDGLHWVPVRKGDFFYVPAGTIHAIGGGITLIEVQQNSDATYRLYDYGSDRELHLQDALEVASLRPYEKTVSPGPAINGRTILVEGPKFVLEQVKGGEHMFDLPMEKTAWLLLLSGSCTVGGLHWKAGECVTVKGTETIRASADADLLLAYPGRIRA